MSQAQSIKSLADRVLSKRAASNSHRTDEFEGGSNRHSSIEPKFELVGFTLADLQTAAGADWSLIEGNETRLTAFALALLHRRMRERGEIPAHYTAATECAGCGPVPIFEGAGDSIQGCPWCFNRVQGLPMPHQVAPVLP